MRPRRMRALSLVAVLAAGCGSGAATGKPLHAFPSRAELARIAAQPQARQPLPAHMAPASGFTLELPPPVSPHPGHALLARVTPHAKPAAGLDCAAHELARILLKTPDKQPALSVQRFVAARCAALLVVPSFHSWIAQSAAAEDDAAIYARLSAELRDAIDGAATQAGIGLARDGERALVVVAFGTPEIELEPFEQVVGDTGVLHIRGRVLLDVAGIQAFVNSGDYGVVACEVDPARSPPAFELRCPLAPGDDAAWVQLLALPRGRVIGHEVLGLIALRSGDAARAYSGRSLGPSRPVADAAAFRAAVLEMLNAVRSRHGLPSLRASQPQSELASSVTPAFFNAILTPGTPAQDLVDAITLGLLAGWDVRGGMIRNGDLTASLIVDSLDAERWLADALERPLGRAVLLDPDSRVLALGATLQREPAVLAAVAVTYAFFEPESSPGERTRQVLDRLARVRKARGLGRTTLVRDAPGMAEQLANIHESRATPEEAMRAAMESVSHALGAPVQGFVWETHDLDLIEFPRELLQPGDLTIAAGVTHYRAQGGAWGQFAVLFVLLNPAWEV